MSDTPPPAAPPPADPARIMQLTSGFWATALLGAGVEHAVFSHIDAGHDTPEAVAEAAEIAPRGAQALLDGLVGLGLLEVIDGRYRNAPDAAAFLVEGRQPFMGRLAQLFTRRDMGDWTQLADVVRTGKPPVAHEVVADNPFWEQLVTAIAPLAHPAAQAAVARLDVAGREAPALLDIGGGAGPWSIAWLGANPAATSTQVDWAPVNAIARDAIARQLGDDAARRFTAIDGDFRTALLTEAAYDAVVYSNIAHQESRASNIALWSRLRRALRPGGTLIVSDFVVEDGRGAGHPFALMFAANMLMHTAEGSSWAVSQYRDWLAEAGFEDVELLPLDGMPTTLIFAR